MSDKEKISLTQEEAITALRIARAGGWHLNKELDENLWPKGKKRFFGDSAHLIKKLERFLDTK
jgi:hypothetical protein